MNPAHLLLLIVEMCENIGRERSVGQCVRVSVCVCVCEGASDSGLRIDTFRCFFPFAYREVG